MLCFPLLFLLMKLVSFLSGSYKDNQKTTERQSGMVSVGGVPPNYQGDGSGAASAQIPGMKAPGSASGSRFDAQLSDIKKNAAFGVYIPDVIKAQSKGRVDYNRDILLQIRREYFTMTQYMQGVYWALTLGAFAGALTISLLTPGGFPDVMGKDAGMIWGVFLLSFGISALISETGAHTGIRKCTFDKWKHDDPKKGIKAGDYKVEDEYRGTSCLSDYDCTAKSQVPSGVCAHPKIGSLSKLMRHLITPLVLLAGVVLTTITFTATGYRMENKDLAQCIIYGIGFGTFFALLFS